MNHLHSLRIKAIYRDEILDLQSLSSPPESLQVLYLEGRLETLPNWISNLDNLVSVSLFHSELTSTADAIEVFQAMPNLIKLAFSGWHGEQLYFDVRGFSKLKWLYLADLKGLNSIVVENGGLPVLNQLNIVSCPQLKEVPSGIRNLRLLKRLYIVYMPTEFLERMRPDKGEDYRIIEHIPNVEFVGNDEGFLTTITPREFQDEMESGRLNEDSEEVGQVEQYLNNPVTTTDVATTSE